MAKLSKAKLIMIFGAPGAGKTAFSLKVSNLLKGGMVINSDLLRDYVALNDKKNFFLNTTSHSAWRHYGEPTEFNVIKGFKTHNHEVWKHLSPLVDSQLEKYKIVIVEGVHFDDEIYQILEEKNCEKYYFFLKLNREEIDNIYNLKSIQRIDNNNPWSSKKSYIFWIDNFLNKVANTIINEKDSTNIQNIYSLSLSNFDEYILPILNVFDSSTARARG